MRIYGGFLLSAGLVIGAFGALLLLHGGWEAVAAGLAVVGGLALVVSLIGLLAAGERRAGRGGRPHTV